VQCVIRGCYEDDDFDRYSIGPVTVDCVSSKWLCSGNMIVQACWRRRENGLKLVKNKGGVNGRWREVRRKGKRETSDGWTDRWND